MMDRTAATEDLLNGSNTHDHIAVQHPLRIKPSGNAYTANNDLRLAAGLWKSLPDEIWILILELLDPCSLNTLGLTCKALFAFSRFEDLWKAFCVQSCPSFNEWHGTWRSTFLSIPRSCSAAIDCGDLHSDILHRPFFCAQITLTPYCRKIPSVNAIPRFQDLSSADFAVRWSSRPFILTAPVKSWPIYTSWSVKYLVRHYGSKEFRAEMVDWPLKTYVQYMRDNLDESPLYLFDKQFRDKLDLSRSAYTPPECFGDDLFAVLGEHRPDNAWLIVGPERSGSTFHKDPNATSAWNAVIRGSKYWIMFPPNIHPPGVYVSEDQSEVTSPLSIAEWLVGFHEHARRTPGCQEGMCREGEVIYVPSGWWHLAINLSETIAITQNFVPKSHLRNVLDFLGSRPEQVTGFSKDIQDPYSLFKQKMQERFPETSIEDLKGSKCASVAKKRKWDQVAENSCDGNSGKGFGFHFGNNDEDDVP